MIRGLGAVTVSTYSQTLNGYATRDYLIESPRTNGNAKWACFGKQNWR